MMGSYRYYIHLLSHTSDEQAEVVYCDRSKTDGDWLILYNLNENGGSSRDEWGNNERVMTYNTRAIKCYWWEHV